MKRRILSIVISLAMVMTLFTATIGTVSAADSGKYSLSGAEKIGGLEEIGDQVRYKMKNKELLELDSKSLKKATKSSAAAAKFSLAERLPAVRNQGINDNCWTYGALASMESSLIMANLAKNNIDLSENHLTWFTYKGGNASTKSAYAGKDSFILTQTNSPYSEGGNRWFSTATLARWYGAVDNSRSLSSSNQTVSDIRLKNADFLPEPARNNANAKKTIKNYLVSKGAVDASYFDDNRYWNSSETAYYYNGSQYANHEVAIVGWDDTYSRDNFGTSKPAGNGAWIVRNSWGNYNSNKGYFYLSYYDTSICDATFYEAERQSYNKGSTRHDFSSIYQYDGVGTGDAEFTLNQKLSSANRYTARKDELIKSVGTYTCAANSTVNISIYVNPTTTNPASGVKKYSKTFNVPYAGYHTLNLGSTIGIPKGDAFSIVVSTSFVSGGKRSYFLANETADDRYYIASSIDYSKGQSFINTGSKWYDVTKMAPLSSGGDSYEIGNALAKALGTSAGSSSQTISVKTKQTKTYGSKPFSLGAKRTRGNGALYYKSSNTAAATVSSSGKVTLKGPGYATITITAAPSSSYKSASKKVAITVKPKRASVTSAKSKKKKTLYVKWKKDSKASGYQVVIAQNKSFKKGKKTATITKASTTSKTFKKLSSRKTYYVKVRAYKKSGGKKVYGSYSKIKKIKTK